MNPHDVPAHVLDWAHQRQRHRQQGDFPAADALRQRIAGAGFAVTDTPGGPVVTRAVRYRAVVPAQVDDRSDHPDGPDVSVLLLLDAAGQRAAPWVVDDARRCLASVLGHAGGVGLQVVICDNGVGGDAGDWAADAARVAGIEAVHLAEPVGFCQARALQHRLATGRLLVWLDTGVELAGDALAQLVDVFDDPGIGVAGRWGGDLGDTIAAFHAVEAPAEGVRDVHAVWGYLLGLRRELTRRAGVAPDPAYRFYRNADADLCYQVRAAGARTVINDLAAVQHGHRGYSQTAPDVVRRESRRNYQRLLGRWRAQMQRQVAGHG